MRLPIGTVQEVDVRVGNRTVTVVCTLVEESGRQGWVLEFDELHRVIEDAAGKQAEEERCHAAE
jgi:hypothetical protein